jgi:hypothetical protein
MGFFKFHKSIRLLPGIYLNISKTGISFSAGVPGARVNIGTKGTRTSVGLPGTGLSYSSFKGHQLKDDPNHPERGPVRILGLPVRLVGVVLLFIVLGGAAWYMKANGLKIPQMKIPWAKAASAIIPGLGDGVEGKTGEKKVAAHNTGLLASPEATPDATGHEGEVWVKGFTRKDGVEVKGHWRKK